MENSIIRIQKFIEMVDGKTIWDRWRYHPDHEFCCTPLKKNPEIELGCDGKFGFPINEYHCGEFEFSHTLEIDFCPHCGKRIEVIIEEPYIKRGKKIVEKLGSGWRQEWIEWDDGTREKRRKYLTFRVVE